MQLLLFELFEGHYSCKPVEGRFPQAYLQMLIFPGGRERTEKREFRQPRLRGQRGCCSRHAKL